MSLRAYPRGRGGAVKDIIEGINAKGLSPRTRGSPITCPIAARNAGPIPADAGEPPAPRSRSAPRRAYPRGRGGADIIRGDVASLKGLSPRTRGSPREARRRCRLPGPIPADAGEPARSRQTRCPTRAYPRGRGGARFPAMPGSALRGLSPRTRGSHPVLDLTVQPLGPIPADAGEPLPSRTGRCGGRAYPRGRGGAIVQKLPGAGRQGLSPRTRGSRRADREARGKVGPIPADAGEPGRPGKSCGWSWAYPRGRGGASTTSSGAPAIRGLSPRTRGSRLGVVLARPGVGPIPADAGEPSCAKACSCRWRAYPRGRGGAPTSSPRHAPERGLSPRTRGSRGPRGAVLDHHGPIPADAGEPVGAHAIRRPPMAYPRGRGGAFWEAEEVDSTKGLSPRTRGSLLKSSP